jgi:alkylhydroperoxidase family enzyme
MKTPLVAPVEQPEDQELQSLIEFYEETLGFCPNSVLTMYHRPRIAYAFIEMNKAVMENKGRVTSALKRLIGYVCSNVAGCRYCQAHTIRAAERFGRADAGVLDGRGNRRDPWGSSFVWLPQPLERQYGDDDRIWGGGIGAGIIGAAWLGWWQTQTMIWK